VPEPRNPIVLAAPVAVLNEYRVAPAEPFVPALMYSVSEPDESATPPAVAGLKPVGPMSVATPLVVSME